MERNPLIDAAINAEYLDANCYLMEDHEIRREFSPLQIEKFKDRLYVCTKRKEGRTGLAKEFAALMKSDSDGTAVGVFLKEAKSLDIGGKGTKSLDIEIKSLVDKISLGYEYSAEKLYGFDYQDISRMAYYDSNGLYVFDRPLRDNEKQSRLFTLKNGTDD